MKKFFPFPSIGQFVNTIRHVKQKTRYAGKDQQDEPIYNHNVLPKIKMIGTVKSHGTNAAWVYDTATFDFGFQSRERVLSLEQDNAGFMVSMLGKVEVLKQLSEDIITTLNLDRPEKVVVFGEWAGAGIQKGVALTELPKMMIIFGVQYVYPDVDGEDNIKWVDLHLLKNIQSTDDKIFNVLNFPTFEVEVDFEHPHIAQNQIVEWTLKVEEECPIGKFFGVSGVGEGLVFSPVENMNDSGFWFKSKGTAHSVTKVRTVAAVDVEMLNTIKEYVEMFVTENRMEQQLDKMTRELLEPFEMKSIGTFIRLVYGDCIKESQEEIVKNQLEVKKLGGPISDVARRWFINKFNSGV